MARKVADCRQFPSDKNCTLTISGEEDEVMKAATEHAISAHGHKMSDQLKADIRSTLKDESGYAPPKSAKEAERR
jgi:predicted small metal-binding protein